MLASETSSLCSYDVSSQGDVGEWVMLGAMDSRGTSQNASLGTNYDSTYSAAFGKSESGNVSVDLIDLMESTTEFFNITYIAVKNLPFNSTTTTENASVLITCSNLKQSYLER